MTPRRSVILIGVSGAGKSTVAKIIADRTGWLFGDADDLQPPANVARMRAGMPLTDLDRRPWLLAVREWISQADRDVVVSCSALRRSYRDLLAEASGEVIFVQLDGDFELIWPRLRDHSAAMAATQLESQLSAFEPLADDEAGFVVGVEVAADVVADRVLAGLDQHAE